eukprot:131178-Rhodomonas_salina.5
MPLHRIALVLSRVLTSRTFAVQAGPPEAVCGMLRRELHHRLHVLLLHWPRGPSSLRHRGPARSRSHGGIPGLLPRLRLLRAWHPLWPYPALRVPHLHQHPRGTSASTSAPKPYWYWRVQD